MVNFKYMMAFALCMSAATCMGESLSPENALGRVMKTDMGRRLKGAAASELLYSFQEDGVPYSYVFKTCGGGDVLFVSADDRCAPLLGYCDSADFNPDNLPPALEYWLRWLGSRKSSGVWKEVGNPGYEPIEPMLTTKWNQDTPYNDLSPRYSDGEPTYTGCVATAMAQVMSYYKYPLHGEGQHEYESYDQVRGKDWTAPVTLDFSSTSFDWENMLDVYEPGNYDEAEAGAVAALMLACGVSVNMNYGIYSSGAFSQTIPYGFWRYLGYNSGCYNIDHDTLEKPEEWEGIVYYNLRDCGPLVYCGVTEHNEGHAFVCDGYDGNGYYHFNWGWGGLADGWFMLDALSPEHQGIGGASSQMAFTEDHSILAGLNPYTGSQGEFIWPLVNQHSNLMISPTKLRLGTEVRVSGKLRNVAGEGVDFQVGLQLTGENETIILHGNSIASLEPMQSGNVAARFALPQDLASGNYIARMVFRREGDTEWKVVPWYQNYTSRMLLSVNESDGIATFSPTTATSVESTSLNRLVESVSNAPEYYTLQGIHVSAPREGETYIRVTPAGATKIIY